MDDAQFTVGDRVIEILETKNSSDIMANSRFYALRSNHHSRLYAQISTLTSLLSNLPAHI
jgi:hypothetical protein